MEISVDFLIKMGASHAKAIQYVPYLNQTMAKYQINTPLRICHFISQVFHESARLNYVREMASGIAYDTGAKAIALGNTPQADGDGQRYKGRGLIQLTGKANYKTISNALGYDFVNNPADLEIPLYACMSAGWYWTSEKLNKWADADDIKTITKRINGGLNGFNDRLYLLNKAKSLLT